MRAAHLGLPDPILRVLAWPGQRRGAVKGKMLKVKQRLFYCSALHILWCTLLWSLLVLLLNEDNASFVTITTISGSNSACGLLLIFMNVYSWSFFCTFSFYCPATRSRAGQDGKGLTVFSNTRGHDCFMGRHKALDKGDSIGEGVGALLFMALWTGLW